MGCWQAWSRLDTGTKITEFLLPSAFLLALVPLARTIIGAIEHETADEVPPMPVPSWYDPVNKPDGFFWHDIGGSMCVCENTWNRAAVWQKMFTGYAFNFPHIFDAFLGGVVLGRTRFETLIMFVMFNEVIEEGLMQICGKWGFRFDPPADMESRWDSLIRDVFCSSSGAHLALVFLTAWAPAFRRNTRVGRPALLEFPLCKDWSQRRAPNGKFYALKVLISTVSIWQLILSYSFRGVYKLNMGNIVVWIFISIWFVTLALWLVPHYPADERPFWKKFFFILYLAMGCIFLPSAYPPYDSVYTILLVEAAFFIVVSLTALITTRATVWGFNFGNCPLACICQLCGGRSSRLRPKTTSASKETEHLEPGAIGWQRGLDGNKPRMYKQAIIKAINNIRERDNNPQTESLNWEAIMEETQRVITDGTGLHLYPTKKWIKYLVISIGIIAFVLAQPLHYDGYMYMRHWCGNPEAARQGINGCVGFVEPYSTSRSM